ncbi:MAG TPA: alpha/beta hydrolase [Chloroflexota bacterium]|nr:alpha/beta hydrolase [Chloroflexota bacterium]
MQTSVGRAEEFPRYDPAAHYAVTTEDVEYRRDGETAWLARVYRPQGSGPFPALLDVHGGAWSAGDRLNDAPMDEALAASGMVVVAVDFRLAPQHPYPASLADVNYATRWVKAHAPDFGADPRHLGALGSSSGGHQIMLSAMRPRDPRYAALTLPGAPDVDATVAYVLACWPILDPYARYLFAQETGRAQLVTRTEGFFLTEEAMQEGNPQRILDRGEAAELPAVLLLQGTADTNLTVEMSERFVASYRAAGGQIEMEIFPDMPHGFGNQPGPESDRAMALMKAFVARQLRAGAPA